MLRIAPLLALVFLTASSPAAPSGDELPARIDAAMESGDFAAAKPLAARLLETMERAGKKGADLARTRQVLGSISDRLGDHAAALALLEQARAEFTAAGAPPLEIAACEDEAGRAALAAGKFETAERLLRSAMLARRAAREETDAAASQIQLAEALLKLGRFAEAGDACREAEQTADPAARALAQQTLGTLAHTGGDPEQALRLFQKALATARSGGEACADLLPGLEGSIGQSLFRAGRSREAEPYLERAAAGPPEMRAAAVNNLAELRLATARPEEAKTLLEAQLANESFTVSSGPAAITLWLNLAAARHRLADLSGAGEALAKAEAAAKNVLPDIHPLRPQLDLEAATLARDRGDEAECARRAETASRGALAWLRAASLKPEEARLLDLRAMLDPVSPLAALTPENTERLADAVLASHGAATGLFLARQKGGNTPTAPTAEEVRNSLPADAALVDFIRWRPAGKLGEWSASEHYGAVILRRARPAAWVDLGPAAPIDARVRRVIAAARDAAAADRETGDRASLLWQCGDLRRMICDPWEQHAAGAARLFLRPDGMLHFVPWAVLRAEDGRFFCQLPREMEIIAFPRAAPRAALNHRPVWRALAAPDAPGESIQALPPEFRAELSDLPALPGVAAEVAALRLAAADRALVETPAATESAWAAPGADILHFAGHGFAFPDPSGRMPVSGLFLRPAPGSDGVLFAEEAAALPLEGVELVTLSGCRTALGHYRAGEHASGLRHAFLTAGARSVAASLWDLNDARAPEMIRLFHTRLAAGDPPARALQSAQRDWLAGSPLPAGVRAAAAGAWYLESAGWSSTR